MSDQRDNASLPADQEEDEELGGSELGTKEYWDSSYDRQVANYESHGDVGEIWFDEDSMRRVIKWMLGTDTLTKDVSIIDLGCGNGMMLVDLACEGFTQLTGMDYSPKAIELAQKIAVKEDVKIEYRVGDLLSDTFVAEFGQFRVVHDKGTYDAISLHPDDSRAKRLKYIENVHGLLEDRPDAVLIVTSCNWTEPELVAAFGGRFRRRCAIPTPTFKFGGTVGSVVTSLVFEKL